MSYARSASLYDAIYDFKDYAAEAAEIRGLLHRFGVREGAILDVGCGTAKHLSLLRSDYIVAGVDLEPNMIAVAKQSVPAAEFLVGDMRTFRFDRPFDAVLCLFSSIGYLPNRGDLDQAIANMAGHIRPGGTLMVEAWLSPDDYHAGFLSMTTVDRPDLKVARQCRSEVEGNVSVMAMHHLVTTSAGVEHFVETHRLTMFSHDEYVAAFERAGLRVERIDGVLTRRGLYVGRSG